MRGTIRRLGAVILLITIAAFAVIETINTMLILDFHMTAVSVQLLIVGAMTRPGSNG